MEQMVAVRMPQDAAMMWAQLHLSWMPRQFRFLGRREVKGGGAGGTRNRQGDSDGIDTRA